MKHDEIYLLHIRSSIQKIIRYTTKGWDEFMADEMKCSTEYCVMGLPFL